MVEIITKLEDIIWSMPLVLALMCTHIFFTIELKFPQKYTLRGLKLMFKSNSSEKGISSFKSLMTVLAATLGTGNIIGVATAITVGGIGSIFWIFISGIFAISTKYAETYLVLKYRKSKDDGYYGGTMYVLKDILNKKGLAILFSIFVIIASFGIGSMIQSNAMSTSICETFKINKTLLAVIITVLCAYVIFGNEKRISDVSSILVPVATILYIVMCVILLYMFRYNIWSSILLIVKEAFSFKSITGGIFGLVIIKALNAGLSKGLFSNEAGMGSSPLFNSTVKMTSIKEESLVSSVSVFIDTVVLCTITGIVLVSSGMWNVTDNAVILTKNAFSLIPYGEYMLTFSLAIFAIATIPCWSYYGSIGIKFLFKNNKKAEKIYKIIYVICVYVGAILQIELVWSISSIANVLMILPNVYMIYKLKDKIET